MLTLEVCRLVDSAGFETVLLRSKDMSTVAMFGQFIVPYVICKVSFMSRHPRAILITFLKVD